MEVLVGPHRPLDVIHKRPVDGGMYQVRIDGVLAGFVGYQQGAKVILHRRFSPLELREIERKVRVQLTPQKIGGIVQVGLKPQFQQQPKENHGDFD